MGLTLKLLGEFALRDESGAALSLPTRKTRGLLGYLAANADRPQPRERLMALLWGNFAEKQARHNLNQALMSLRKLGVSLDSDGEQVTLRGDTMEIDLARFHAIRNADPATAAALCEGPFLDGLVIADPAFEDWLALARTEIHEQAVDVLERTADAAAGNGDTNGAIAATRRLVALDPLREDAHRRLMQLLHENGDRTGALRQYQTCAEILRTELQVEPDAATETLLVQIKNATLPSPPEPPARSAYSQLEKGSIAVLPFENMSGDPDQAYFADGITDDIITTLSNMRTFTVLSRSATFAYKGKSIDARQIGRELDVDYVIEGSVRRAGNRVRVTAQLINTTTGEHVWAERFNGTLDDIFDFQDQVTSKIVGTVEPELFRAEGLRLEGKPPADMNAYDYLLRGQAHMHKVTRDDNAKALGFFEKSIALDPSYGRAYAFASWCYRRDVQERGLEAVSDEQRQKAIELARNALLCDRNDPLILGYAACVSLYVEREFDEALDLMDRALAMNPNSHRAWNGKAQVHSFRGETEQAIEAGDRGIAISPNNSAIWSIHWMFAQAHLQDLRYEEAAEYAKRATRQYEHLAPAYFILASASAHLGQEAAARDALAAALSINPGMTIQRLPDCYPLARLKNLDVYLDGLREAGLPEQA